MATDPYTDGTPGWQPPNLNRGMLFRDQGTSGLRQFSGWVREEFLVQLQSRYGARAYREMLDNSPTVGALNFAITQAMRKAQWRVQPANDSPLAAQYANFVETCRDDMSHTWEDFVTEALSMLGYGYAPHEIVYKRRLGRKTGLDADGSPRASSKYSDGLIGWRKLPIRGQDTVIRWYFATDGAPTGLQQQPWVGSLIDLPIEKLLLFRPTVHKGNPEGRSILRNSWIPYTYIKRLQEFEAISIERLGGLPVMKVPNDLLQAAAAGDANAKAMVAAYQELVVNIRIDEQMGLVLPSDTWQDPVKGMTNIPMFEFQFITPNMGRASLNIDKTIERYKLEMLTTMLADFIQLGHATRGTQGLAEAKVDMFYSAIEGWLNSMAATLNRFAIPRLWALNGFDPDLMPEFVPDLAQRIDLAGLGTYILSLAQAGMSIFPDEDVENFLREAAGLPDIQESAEAAALPPDADMLQKMIKKSVFQRIKEARNGLVRNAV